MFGVIGASLLKIAFFPDTSDATNPAVPTATIVEPHYEVVTGTIKNDVTLTGTVAADEGVPIPATLSGEVREVSVSPGQAVSAGDEILKLRAVVTNPDGSSDTDWDIVTAPISGVLTNFTALVGKTYSVGDPVGQVAPPSFHVSGSIPAEQLYRLVNRPADAQVTINGGPAPFACTGLTITAQASGQTGGGTTGGSGGTGGTGGTGDASQGGPVVRCAVPGDVTVFAGLSAKLVIAGGVAENVLVVPITAVEGSAGSGNVYLVGTDGSTEKRAVTLGLNDGTNVEVKDGLAAGDTILQFLPGAPASTDPSGANCKPIGNGGMACGG